MYNECLNENNKPLICICIPVKNGGHTIGDTINSLLNQDYEHIEIIIYDNLSTDNTRQVIEDISSKTIIPITYKLNIVEGSAEENWNSLLKNISTKAEYIALYHADDLYEPSIISKQLKLIESKPVGAVFTLSRLINEKGKDISRKHKHSLNLPKEIRDKCIFDYQSLLNYTLRNYNFVKAPTFFFRKSILNNYDIYFDTAFKTSADLDFWLRIARKDKIAIIKEPLHLYRISKSQGTFTLLKGREEPADYFKVMDYHISKSEVTPEALKWYYAYRSMDSVLRALNLTKINKQQMASEILNQAININHLPQLIHISNGIKNYLFGVALKGAISIRMEKILLKIIHR